MVFGSSAPATDASIASVTYVGVATATVTLKGGRPLKIDVCATLNNAAAAARDYTWGIAVDGVVIHSHTTSNDGADDSAVSSFYYDDDGDTAGSHTYSLFILSSNATGTQTAEDAHILLMEY